MINLEQSFKRRDEIFHKETEKILNDLNHVVLASKTFIDKIYGTDKNRNITWEGVNLIDGLINLIGIVSYSLGTTLFLNNESTLITEANVEQFQQIIRINVPLLLAVDSTTEEIIQFLLKQQEDMTNNNHDEISDFDLTKLSNQQLDSLITSEKYKIN